MDEYSKGLEAAAIAAAKTPGIPVSMTYAAAREIWTLWWQHKEERKPFNPWLSYRKKKNK